LCVASIGYVWHRNRNEQLGRLLRQRAAALETLRLQNQSLDRQLEELRSPRALEAAIQRWRLGLVVPQPDQVLRLPGTRPDALLRLPASVRLAAAASKP
jgi:cell division protein FtsB